MENRPARPAVAAPLVLSLALLLLANSPLLADPFGGWKPAPDVQVPGSPIAELEFGGTTYLLLEGLHPDSAVDAFLWNPSQVVPLAAGPDQLFVSVDSVVGVQLSAGAAVFACGLFYFGGVETRLAQWNGVEWTLPGVGPVTGPAIRSTAVRRTVSGEELWIGGGLLTLPGLTTPRTIASYDGQLWRYPGGFDGLVDTITSYEPATGFEEHLIVTGENLVTFGGVGGNLLHYDGSAWDDLDGGVNGVGLEVSVLRLDPGEVEIWVTGVIVSAGPLTSVSSIARHRQGAWEAFTASGGLLLGSPGKLRLLPTAFGEMVFAELPVFSFPGSGSFLAAAWDPSGTAWVEVPVGSEGAYRFQSPSGLFPHDPFFRSTSPLRLRWEASAGVFLRGDANGDGSINIGDAIQTLNHLFVNLPLTCPAAADLNADDTLDLADPIALLTHLFVGAPFATLPAPWPACDFADNFGDLTCDESGCP
ncbi:MAG: dockerin type I repeat-containing protein [Planctomycetota bacterium]|jgi:hypothetical protein